MGSSYSGTGELLWDTQRDTRRDPQAGCSGGILGGIHWQAALAGYSAGSTGEPLLRDTRRDPLASCSGGILGGIHWQASRAGYWVGAWCRSIANADSDLKSNNPFPSGKYIHIYVSANEPSTLAPPHLRLAHSQPTARLRRGCLELAPEPPPAQHRRQGRHQRRAQHLSARGEKGRRVKTEFGRCKPWEAILPFSFSFFLRWGGMFAAFWGVGNRIRNHQPTRKRTKPP